MNPYTRDTVVNHVIIARSDLYRIYSRPYRRDEEILADLNNAKERIQLAIGRIENEQLSLLETEVKSAGRKTRR